MVVKERHDGALTLAVGVQMENLGCVHQERNKNRNKIEIEISAAW